MQKASRIQLDAKSSRALQGQGEVKLVYTGIIAHSFASLKLPCILGRALSDIVWQVAFGGHSLQAQAVLACCSGASQPSPSFSLFHCHHNEPICQWHSAKSTPSLNELIARGYHWPFLMNFSQGNISKFGVVVYLFQGKKKLQLPGPWRVDTALIGSRGTANYSIRLIASVSTLIGPYNTVVIWALPSHYENQVW